MITERAGTLEMLIKFANKQAEKLFWCSSNCCRCITPSPRAANSLFLNFISETRTRRCA